MLTMDVPHIPPQDTPVIVRHVGNTNTPATPDFILNVCTETQPTPHDPSSAMRVVDPAGMFQVYAASVGMDIPLADVHVTLKSTTKHGKLTAEVDNTGMRSYRYAPYPGFLGNDRAIFMAEYGGKHYKIVMEIKVLVVVDERSPECPDAILIRAKKPVSNSS